MKKKLVILLAILLVIVVALLIAFFMITGSSTVKAQLIYEQGTVSVNGQPVNTNTKLSQGDSIETASDSKATVILYESVVISLEPNTEITLDELTKTHPQVSQSKGETWNKFTKLFGVTDYTITSGNSVASVRGTSFTLADDKIIVDEGEVAYTLEGQNFTVTNQVVEKIGNRIKRRNLTPEEKTRLQIRINRAIRALQALRQAEINKHPRLLSMAKSRYGATDEQIQQIMEDADNNKINLNDFKDKVPVNINSVEKIIKITDKIKQLKQHSKTLNAQ